MVGNLRDEGGDVWMDGDGWRDNKGERQISKNDFGRTLKKQEWEF